MHCLFGWFGNAGNGFEPNSLHFLSAGSSCKQWFKCAKMYFLRSALRVVCYYMLIALFSLCSEMKFMRGFCQFLISVECGI